MCPNMRAMIVVANRILVAGVARRKRNAVHRNFASSMDRANTMDRTRSMQRPSARTPLWLAARRPRVRQTLLSSRVLPRRPSPSHSQVTRSTSLLYSPMFVTKTSKASSRYPRARFTTSSDFSRHFHRGRNRPQSRRYHVRNIRPGLLDECVRAYSSPIRGSEHQPDLEHTRFFRPARHSKTTTKSSRQRSRRDRRRYRRSRNEVRCYRNYRQNQGPLRTSRAA